MVLTLFGERGVCGIPTSQISKGADVATGTLFFLRQKKNPNGRSTMLSGPNNFGRGKRI
jgi:hypothetical protein